MISFPPNVKFTTPEPGVVEVQLRPDSITGDFDENSGRLRIWFSRVSHADWHALTAVMAQPGWKMGIDYGLVIESLLPARPQGLQSSRVGFHEVVSFFIETVARRLVLPDAAP